ncbi:hypothetical protein D3C87_1118720 [compost metagenome]
MASVPSDTSCVVPLHEAVTHWPTWMPTEYGTSGDDAPNCKFNQPFDNASTEVPVNT